MNEKDWQEFKKLYEEYVEARDAYLQSQKHLHGAFSEMARDFPPDALDKNWLVEEQEAHERFNEKRAELHEFLQDRLKQD